MRTNQRFSESGKKADFFAVIFKMVVFRALKSDFNNVLCFVKLRPTSRRCVDLEGMLVHFEAPLDTTATIANT